MLRSIFLNTLYGLSIIATITTTATSQIVKYPYNTSRTAIPGVHLITGGSFIGKYADHKYPNPEPCKGNCSWIHDPSIVKKGGKYYRFSTSGNIAIATAPAIEGPWTYQGALLTNGTKIVVDAVRQDIWAPNVIKIGPTYYCYYAVSFLGSQDSQIGVATSTSLDPGTWTDHGSYNLPQSASYNLIDPSLIQASPDSPIYLTFGTTNITTNTTDDPNNNNSNTAIADSATATLPPIINIARNSSLNADVIEGATIYKHSPAGKYYLFFSAGNCCAVPPNLPAPGREYKVLVCRSDGVEGPFVDREGRRCLGEDGGYGGTVVLGSHGDVYAPGGQGVRDEAGRTVLYYHYGEFGFFYPGMGGRGWLNQVYLR
ncbi:Arabinanase/levansucrase/invertase [Byssothecium circinans]|uniref:Endo-1,5-alpha-L-arabinanase A n=1 Tax=Byssothecium circinans TaxID=147558 RepID=A0A6A5TCT6_9PLEO|nr:Arabinanase/levansucrase/invertase [Byssothecium circinans]